VTSGTVGESTQYGEQDVSLGNIAYGQCPCYVCGSMRISIALAQDADSQDLESIVTDAWNLRTFSAVEIDATATVIAGCAATTTAGAGVIAYADLVAAFFAVSPLYRASAIWVFSTAAMKALRNLKDASTNRPVLLDTPSRTQTDAFGQTSLTPMLLGCPAYESNAFDNAVSTGKNVGYFGATDRVLPIRRGPATLQFLKETWITYGQYGYVGRQYFDASQIGIAAAGTVIKVQ
jgi:HK97 family phage major capsid protein